ncbi:DUF5011 domain-containing protein [Paraglaciecola sp. L3A3]|uniref:DUF5011 domain-containing protein n=1 Tax=Paraglaciecola sp. L3A3 TaxID=2686358 RepID=UPI00131CA0BC|nr:DUF5011 domain-containing protein [Paraglaciecola sp. L3A3]
MNKFKLLAISSLITLPLIGCGSSDDDKENVFSAANANVDYYGPTLTITGGDSIEVAVDSTYADLGATAFDNVDGDVTSNIVAISNVDTANPATYSVVYTVVDVVGNETSATRTVTVPDTILPVITLNGDATVIIPLDSSYTDEGATASDNPDGDLSASIVADVSNVDTSTLGEYTVSYNVVDAAGNEAIELIRTVSVQDIADEIAPVIMAENTHVSIDEGAVFTPVGVTAVDDVDGDITDLIVSDTSSLDTNTAGVYPVTYNVSDAGGNDAEEVVQQVHVIPVIADVDIVMDVLPTQAKQAVEFTGSTESQASQMFATNNGTKMIDHMLNTLGLDMVHFGIHPSIAIDDAVYSDIQTVAAYAKSKGMKIIASVSGSKGAWGSRNAIETGRLKYSQIASCESPCDDDFYGIDLSDYATYLDTYLTNMAAAGGAVDYLAPFSNDEVDAIDYQTLLAAMTGDDALTIIGPESYNIVDADIEYAAVADHVDIAGAEFFDHASLRVYEQQDEWNEIAAAAASNSVPLWFTQNQSWLSEGGNANEQTVFGIAQFIPAINAGAERIISGQYGAVFAWFNGGNTGVRGNAIKNFVEGSKGNVVDSIVYSEEVRGTAFRENDTLYVMLTNTNKNVTVDSVVTALGERKIAVRLQEGETINGDVVTLLYGTGKNGGTIDTTVNAENNIITFTLPLSTYIRLAVPLTPTP